MKNKFLTIVLTVIGVFILMIVYLNFTTSPNIKIYSFERNFKDAKEILTYADKLENPSRSQYVLGITSDENMVVCYDYEETEQKDSLNYSFYYYDTYFNNLGTYKAVVPKNVNVLYTDTQKLLFVFSFKLYRYFFETGEIKLIDLKGLQISSLIPTNTPNQYLCLAEYDKRNGFETGFYLIDAATNEITPVKALENNEESKITVNMLKYSGYFKKSSANDLIVYYCTKYSKIYFFNSIGTFKKEMDTADRTPAPVVITSKEGMNYYKRGSTWNNNHGLLFGDGEIGVFSARTQEANVIITDFYSLSDFEYKRSYRTNYKGFSSYDILSTYGTKERIVFLFDTYFASFDFSRYINDDQLITNKNL
ncbi:hypothetical protein [Ascidiimonas aurantiaca]|uniref:hypothetical protein n=1 Tax=Ascidiimonas aurantiaca TaxID=1685432 RepID=UPI0030ECF1C8